MNRFRVVATGDACEGMCLYEDVRDRSGNVLLPRLTTLSGAMIRSLQRRDIDALQVVDDSVTPEQLAAERLRVQERLAYLCRHTGSGRANLLLRRVVEQYRMAELS
jgi:hypothetical protein